MFDIQSWGLSVLLLPWLSRRCSARSLYAALLILLVAFLIPVRPAFLRIRLPQATYTAPAPIAAPQPIGVPGGVTMQPIPATNDSLSPEPTRSAVCPALHTPMVAGLVRPRILLPDEKLSTSELHFVCWPRRTTRRTTRRPAPRPSVRPPKAT